MAIVASTGCVICREFDGMKVCGWSRASHSGSGIKLPTVTASCYTWLTTCRVWPHSSISAVHPHGCGEQHWYALWYALVRITMDRFIPAGVGNTGRVWPHSSIGALGIMK